MRSNLMLFGAQKGKGPGTWPFPSSPIKSGCSSEAVSYRSEHKWAKEVQNCVGLHSCLHLYNTQGHPFAILQPVFLSQICNLSPKLPQLSRASGAIFPTWFFYAVVPTALHSPVLWQVPPWKQLPLVWELPPPPSSYLPLILWLLVYVNAKICLGG